MLCCFSSLNFVGSFSFLVLGWNLRILAKVFFLREEEVFFAAVAARRNAMNGEKKETFLGMDLKNAGSPEGYKVFLDQILTNLSPEERIFEIEKVLNVVIRARNDKVAVFLLELLEKAYQAKIEADLERTEEKWKHEKDIRERTWASFRGYLKKLYWTLPDQKQIDTRYDRLANGHVPVWGPALVEAKLWILKKLIGEWQLSPSAPGSWEAFRFFIAAYRPLPKDYLKREGESDDEMQARGRQVYEEERKGILDLIRQHTGCLFKPDNLEEWISQPYVPEEIKQILVIARARNGGAELVERDIRNNKLLACFEPDKRSPAALALFKGFGNRIAGFDLVVQELLQAMQPSGWDFGSDKIGESDYVAGTISIEYPELGELVVKVELKPDCTEELGRDIFGRARRHLEQWCKKHTVKQVKLCVCGGKADLFLDFKTSSPSC